jgi:hypothetical protein
MEEAVNEVFVQLSPSPPSLAHQGRRRRRRRRRRGFNQRS